MVAVVWSCGVGLGVRGRYLPLLCVPPRLEDQIQAPSSVAGTPVPSRCGGAQQTCLCSRRPQSPLAQIPLAPRLFTESEPGPPHLCLERLSLNTRARTGSRTTRLPYRGTSAFAAWMRLMPNAAPGLPLPCRLAWPLHQHAATQQQSRFPSSRFRSPTPPLGDDVSKACITNAWGEQA